MRSRLHVSGSISIGFHPVTKFWGENATSEWAYITC